MSHDRRHDPATPETSHPADNTSSSTPQFVSGIISVDSQTWERESLSAYTTHLLERLEGSYAEDSFAPVTPYNDNPWPEWTYPSLSHTQEPSGDALSESWIDPEQYNVSLDELSPWAPDEPQISNHIGSSNTRDSHEALIMQSSPSCLSNDVTLAPLLPTLRDCEGKAGLEDAIFRGDSMWSLAPSLLPEAQSSNASLPEAQEVVLCEVCDASFSGESRRGNLGRHRRLKHASDVLFPCGEDHCKNVFRRKDARLKHYRSHHPWMAGGSATSRRSLGQSSADTLPETSHETGVRLHCAMCQLTFGRAAELRRHNKSFHDSNTPEFYCEVPGCPRGIEPFARKDKLRDHMDKMHVPPTITEASGAGEEDMQIIYSCPEDGCDRSFDHKADLLRHQRTHTAKSERKHKCLQCDESFLYPKDLKRHESTHLSDGDEDKPSFYCEIASCEYGPGSQGFSRKDALLRHIKNLHPDFVLDKKDA